MIIVNVSKVEGKEISEYLGIVNGSVVLSRNALRDIGSSFKTIVGGELKAYTEMQDNARIKAYERMVKKAESLGADAILEVRYMSSSVMQGASEVFVYGTAVKFK